MSFSPTAMYAGSTTSQEWRRMPDSIGHLLETLGAGRVPLTLHSGEGALLFDSNGKEYWDFYGGHAVTLLGQGHPRLVEAIATQARQLTFMTTLADVPVRTKAAASLCAFTSMPVCWFVNSGAEANEAALKIARKVTGRSVIVAMEHGFHGRTMGALGVTWGYRDQHAPAHGEVRFAKFGDLASLDAVLDDQVAAVITEPVQGIAGIVVPPEGWLAEVEKRAHANGSVLIADEVQSGIGRAGYPLLSHAMGAHPDLVTVGKGVGGGFPVAAVLMTEPMARSVKPGEHGTTFGGGPLACAAVAATLDAIREEHLLDKARELEAYCKEKLKLPGVVEVRGSGVWIGVVLDRPAKPVAAALLERRFLVGTASDPAVLRLCPPAVTPKYAVDALADALKEILA
jgi:acetylornithine aminotransferase/acetylornithine/N-succinyldiaminopimelate aminotransferase